MFCAIVYTTCNLQSQKYYIKCVTSSCFDESSRENDKSSKGEYTVSKVQWKWTVLYLITVKYLVKHKDLSTPCFLHGTDTLSEGCLHHYLQTGRSHNLYLITPDMIRDIVVSVGFLHIQNSIIIKVSS